MRSKCGPQTDGKFFSLRPSDQPEPDDVIVCYGNAKPEDVHLASTIHCVDGEIHQWLKAREQRKKIVPPTYPAKANLLGALPVA